MRIVICIIVFTFVTCVPFRKVIIPEVIGRVFNINTKEYVANAQVYFIEDSTETTITDSTGRFVLPGKSKKALLPLFIPGVPDYYAKGTIVVRKSGYVLDTVPVGSIGGKVEVDIPLLQIDSSSLDIKNGDK